MRRLLLWGCFLCVFASTLPASAVTVLSEKDWQSLKSLIRTGPLSGVVGSPVPQNCTAGQLFFDTAAAVGEQFLICVAPDTWVQVQSGTGASGLQAQFAVDPNIISANAADNALTVGNGSEWWAFFVDPTYGLRAVCVVGDVLNACNHVIELAAGFELIVNNAVGTPIFNLASDTGALTAVTLDAEGTGNSIKIKRYLTKEFAGCQAGVASTIWDYPSSNAPTAACKGSNMNKGVLEFPDGATDLVTTIKEYLHEDWTGAIEATLVWESASTSTNNALWSIAIACAGAGESSDPAFTYDDFAVDANNGTANTYNLTSVNTVTTTGTCTANKVMHIGVKRKLSDAADTLAATAQAVLLSLKLREAQ